MMFPFFAGSRATAAGLDAVLAQVQFVAADVPIASTSPTTLLTFPVVTGTYQLTSTIIWIQGATQAKQALRVTGPAISFCRISVRETEMSPTGESVFANSITALATDLFGSSAGQPAASSVVWDVTGVFQFTAAGTLAIVARCAVSSADTYTVKAGSSAWLIQ